MHGRARLRPWEIDRMTLPEVLLALDDDFDTRKGPRGMRPVGATPGAAAEYAAAWRSQGLRERLARAKEGARGG